MVLLKHQPYSSLNDEQKKLKREHWLSLMLCTLIAFSVVQSTICGLIRLVIPNTLKIDTMLFYALYAWILLSSSKFFLKKIRVFDLMAVIISSIILLISALSINDGNTVSEIMVPFLIYCIPAYLLSVNITMNANLKRYLHTTGYIMLTCGAISMFVLNAYSATAETHSLLGGYTLATATAIIIAFSTSKIEYVIATLGALLVLSNGSRGPLLTLLLFIVIYIIIVIPKNAKMILYIIAVCGILVIIMAFYEEILMNLIRLIDSWGFSTRVFTSLLSNNIANDDNRQILQAFALDYMKEHWLWGTGVLLDRAVIYQRFGRMFSDVGLLGAYIHNIFYEWMIQFGTLFGGILGIATITRSIQVLIHEKSRDEKLLFLCIASTGLFPLFVSFSYVTYTSFYLFLGMICRSIQREKTR